MVREMSHITSLHFKPNQNQTFYYSSLFHLYSPYYTPKRVTSLQCPSSCHRFRYSFVCQSTSTRKQRRDLLGLRIMFSLRAVHKGRTHKIAKKLTSPCLQYVHTGSTPLSVRTHHKFRKIRCFLHQKLRTSTSEDPPTFLVRGIYALDKP